MDATNTTDAFKQLEDIQVEEQVKRARTMRRDPFARKRRKRPRGTSVMRGMAYDKRKGIKDTYENPYVVDFMLRQAMRKQNHENYKLAVAAQKEIEQWLRSRGFTWRGLEQQINHEHKGKWRFIERALMAFGHKPQLENTSNVPGTTEPIHTDATVTGGADDTDKADGDA